MKQLSALLLCLVVYTNANTVTKWCTVPFNIMVPKSPCNAGYEAQKLTYAAGRCETSNDNSIAIKPNSDCTAYTLYTASISQSCNGTIYHPSTPGPVCVDCNGGNTSCTYFGVISAASLSPPFGPPPPGPGQAPSSLGAVAVAPLFALICTCLALLM
eukprot:TRINITY_DN18231_c0_g1_i1.p1 TRINITY_DN18231_c0_g1~~TRINITY_DN18231_c0_g1_i1.p1  ORF type:complete len:157 (-),score=22.74 TRINITY_DN18231_c0_g1_i1:170-640(-)